jgi:hypothetical protein
MQAREGRVTAAALNATALDAHSDIRVDPEDTWTQAGHIEGVPPDSRLIVARESLEERGAQLRHWATLDDRRLPDAVA